MEDPQLWRRLLVNSLLEAGFRLTLLARLLDRSVADMLTTLADRRASWAGKILRDFPDDELAAELGQTDGQTTADEVVEEETTVAAEQGTVAALALASARERALRDLVADLTDLELPTIIRDRLREDLTADITLLEEAAERIRMRDGVIEFTTKSAGTGRRAGSQRVFDVWFGTNRARIEKDGVLIGFSADTGGATTLGKCGVTIPRTHRIGEDRPPWWRRIAFGEKPLSLESVTELHDHDFWREVRERIACSEVEHGDAIVFLHGYNVPFVDAAIRAAQIGADLNIPGGTAFFSWPSQGQMHGYTADEASIEASELAITEFLEQFSLHSGARRVHLIAHSMGNRGLLRAVDRIAAKVAQSSGKPFGQIILAAPDVDRRTFVMLAKAYPLVSSRTTLYVSAKDLAVRSSRFVHAADRVGFEPPVTIQSGIDTVRVGKVDLSFLGHGYVAGCRAVLTDIHQLIVSDLAPDRRAGMTVIDSGDGRHWELAA